MQRKPNVLASSRDWRTPVLVHFSQESAAAGRLTVVFDPDRLLAEAGVAAHLYSKGFETIELRDAVRFRFDYEQRFRRRWRAGEHCHAIVVVPSAGAGDANVPFDVLQEAESAGRVLRITLATVFPDLAPTVLASLDADLLDDVHAAWVRVAPGPLGERGTQTFLLDHVFGLDVGDHWDEVKTFQALLELHVHRRRLPATLAHVLQNQGATANSLADEGVLDLLQHRAEFLGYLGLMWNRYISECVATEPSGTSESPVQRLFGAESTRAYVARLILAGELPPVEVESLPPPGSWWGVGVSDDPARAEQRRFEALHAELEQLVPDATATVRHWLEFAPRWGQYLLLRGRIHARLSATLDVASGALAERVQEAFQVWMLRSYAESTGLHVAGQPVFAHRVLDFIATNHDLRHGDRVALLVMDGMAFEQWHIFAHDLHDFSVETCGLFAWVPTLTQVGRQAIFSGRIPAEFEKSIGGTSAEAAHWRRFWAEQDLEAKMATFVPPQGEGEIFSRLSKRITDAAAHPSVRVLGGVIGVVDQGMHGAVLGAGAFDASLTDWSRRGELAGLLRALIEEGYVIYLTADHGNSECLGIGKPNVGVTAEQRGERAHIFRESTLAEQAALSFPGSISWPRIGLPDDYFALLAPAGTGFFSENRRAVSHGGIALEEVVVPFVTIRGRA